jgi:hypothetical protein
MFLCTPAKSVLLLRTCTRRRDQRPADCSKSRPVPRIAVVIEPQQQCYAIRAAEQLLLV